MCSYHGDLVKTYRMYGLVYDTDRTWDHVAYQADQTYLSRRLLIQSDSEIMQGTTMCKANPIEKNPGSPALKNLTD